MRGLQNCGQAGRRAAISSGMAPGWEACAVIAVALLARVVCAVETRGVPTVWHLVGDAAGYFRWAREITGGAWVGTEPFYQAPLYPYVLAVCFKVFGEGVGTIRMVQTVWGAAACGLIYIGTSRLFGRRAGLIAGMMLALYAPAIFFDGIVQKASLTCLLVCALFAATTFMCSKCRMANGEWRMNEEGTKPRSHGATEKGRGTEEGRREGKTARRLRSGFGLMPIGALVIGVIGGLLSITRENAMVWLPVLGLWVWAECRMANGECRMKRRSDGATKPRSHEVKEEIIVGRGWGHTFSGWQWCWGRWGFGMRW